MASKSDYTVSEKALESQVVVSTNDFDPTSRFRKASILNRVGVISGWLFLTSFIILKGAFGFLAFLWFAHETNEIWRRIVLKDWMTRCVSFMSTVIRWSITTQTALSLSMVAALALEKFWVPHGEAAAVSIMRIGGNSTFGTVKDFIWPMTFRGPKRNFRLAFLIILTTS